jgi:hypothetical protein
VEMIGMIAAIARALKKSYLMIPATPTVT